MCRYIAEAVQPRASRGCPARTPRSRSFGPNGHRWRAWLTDRTKRLTRCRRCHRPWADETSALDVVHPELVAEWDAPTNYPKTPQRTKATSKTVVTWLCRDHPDEHPTYPMSPLARGNWITRGRPGCPECRKALTKAARRSPRRRAAT